VTLICANQTEADILLKETIDKIAAEHSNISVIYSIDRAGEKWKGLKGFLTAETLKKNLPPPSLGKDLLICVCGPPPFYAAISGDKDFSTSPPGQGELTGFLAALKYSKDQVYKF